jgi:hypothetical protein
MRSDNSFLQSEDRPMQVNNINQQKNEMTVLRDLFHCGSHYYSLFFFFFSAREGRGNKTAAVPFSSLFTF